MIQDIKLVTEPAEQAEPTAPPSQPCMTLVYPWVARYDQANRILGRCVSGTPGTSITIDTLNRATPIEHPDHPGYFASEVSIVPSGMTKDRPPEYAEFTVKFAKPGLMSDGNDEADEVDEDLPEPSMPPCDSHASHTHLYDRSKVGTAANGWIGWIWNAVTKLGR